NSGDDHRQGYEDRFFTRLQHQLAVKPGPHEGREDADDEDVDLDVLFDEMYRERANQEQKQDNYGSGNVHAELDWRTGAHASPDRYQNRSGHAISRAAEPVVPVRRSCCFDGKPSPAKGTEPA